MKRVKQKTNTQTPTPPTTLTPPPHQLSLTTEYKETIANTSYLGKKGYTILKEHLQPDDLRTLYKELYLTPEIIGANGKPETGISFPVYRENDKKIYIPRFYGIKRYGFPKKTEIGNPAIIERIELPFVKSLRDYQETVVNTYIQSVTTTATTTPHPQPIKGGGGILSLYTGAGKTVCAIKIISIIGLKTLIIVHKEFLMNQWTERILEFTPNARIGRIQGSVIDIENKDIVIAMMQTLYNEEKTFPLETFGLCIVDEVHRIGSIQYHKALLQIQTPYCLGISATVKRKDKMDELIYMFLGDIVYSMERKGDDIVSVRAIEYSNKEEEYNEIIQDYRGETLYSSMVSKVCNFHPRNDFICKIIKDLIEENPKSQILVLGHLRSMLEYIYIKITDEHVSSGFYVGGMKQHLLDETANTKQVVLSTYMMSSEALDIPTLSTLVFTSPKTDVIQCVGRILRKKHDNPIIVDIVDTHSIFQNQWRKRCVYYKKCNYKIQKTGVALYGNMMQMQNTHIWKTLYLPSFHKGVKTIDNEDDSNKGDLLQKKCLVDCSVFHL